MCHYDATSVPLCKNGEKSGTFGPLWTLLDPFFRSMGGAVEQKVTGYTVSGYTVSGYMLVDTC